MRKTALPIRALVVWVFLSAIVTSAFAATATKINDDALAPLRRASVMKKVRLDKLPLYDGKRSIIDLEEFQVWAPGAKVVIHGDNGVVLEKQDPPPMRFFRGLVNGNPESFAYFSVDMTTLKIDGMIDTGDRKLALASSRHIPHSPRSRDQVDEQQFDNSMTEADVDQPLGTTWQCQVDKTKIGAPNEPIHATGINGLPVIAQGISGTQSYSITVEIETDYELYHTVALDSASAVTTYVTNLSGAVSTIYNRDLHTNVVQKNINIYTSVSDPWAAVDPFGGLDELGDAYHNVAIKPSGRTTSAVVFLSGKNIGGGVAWEGVVCAPDFFQNGHWGGPYAWCGGIGDLDTLGFGSIPNVSTPPYTMPTGTQNFWPVYEYAHELGHNLGGHHTHCVQTSDGERIAAGFTDGSPADPTSDQVDHCYAHEGLAGCFAAATDYLAGSQGAAKGTIMSYCQNVNAPQATGSRFTFGQPVEGSHNELDNYMLRSAGPLSSPGTGFNGGPTNIVNGVGAFMISAITAPATVTPSSTGNAASITASPSAGATYAWQITGGTITSSATTSAITFTAGASGTVILRATGYNTQLCGVTDTKSITISSVTYNPPTNVVATATSTTSAIVTWTAATGTAPGRYNVYRSADSINYTLVGSSTGTTFPDSPLSTNKAYLYKVRSADSSGNNESVDSNRDLATIVIYTNTTLTAVVSTIQAVDLNELRTAVNAVRSLNLIGPGAYTYSPITPGASIVHALDISQLRTNLNTALSGMSLPLPSYTNGTITAGTSVVMALDFNELRAAVR
jgi:Metallo-peptidase family M12